MAKFTKEYIPCECRVSLFFPAGEITCDLCPLLETYSRRQCRRTGELLPNWMVRGDYCPLELPDDMEFMEEMQNDEAD